MNLNRQKMLKQFNNLSVIGTRLANKINIKHLREDFDAEGQLRVWEAIVLYSEMEEPMYPIETYVYLKTRCALINYYRREKGHLSNTLLPDIDLEITKSIETKLDLHEFMKTVPVLTKSIVFLRVSGESWVYVHNLLGLSVRQCQRIYKDFKESVTEYLYEVE